MRARRQLDFGNGLYDNCNCPLVERMQQFQEIGNLTWTVGKHTFKFGPDFHYNQNLRLPSDQHRSGEVYSFNNLTVGEVGASQIRRLGYGRLPAWGGVAVHPLHIPRG